MNDVSEMKTKLERINWGDYDEEEEEFTDEEKKENQKFFKNSLDILDEVELNFQKLRKNSKDLKPKFRYYCGKLEDIMVKSESTLDMSHWRESLQIVKWYELDKEGYLDIILKLRKDLKILTGNFIPMCTVIKDPV